MSGTQKKGFAAFLRPTPPEPETVAPQPTSRPVEIGGPPPMVMTAAAGEEPQLQVVPPALLPPPRPIPAPTERIRTVTSTGRIRTHSANRQLPGVTYRVSEERWERLKMLSIQERRPIQEMLGEAVEAYMKNRGLPW